MTDENGKWFWFRRWTDMEARVMTKNRICLRCESKMGLTHDCRHKSWAVLLVVDEDDLDDNAILIVSDDKLEKRGEVYSVSDPKDLSGGWSESHFSDKIETRYGASIAFPTVDDARSSEEMVTKAFTEATMIELKDSGLGKTIPIKEVTGSDLEMVRVAFSASMAIGFKANSTRVAFPALATVGFDTMDDTMMSLIICDDFSALGIDFGVKMGGIFANWVDRSVKMREGKPGKTKQCRKKGEKQGKK